MNVFRAKREREKRKRNEAQVSEWTGPVIFCEWNFPSGPLYVEIHSDGPIWSSRLGPTNVGWITSHPHGQFRSARLSLPAPPAAIIKKTRTRDTYRALAANRGESIPVIN